MIGPLFGLELRQDRGRGRRFYLLPWAYAALLAFQAALSPWWGGGAQSWSAASLLPTAGPRLPTRLPGLVGQHFVLLLLLAPAVTATAFSGERARGTLPDLLTTALTSAEIVLGKLLARLLRVLEVSLAGLPVLCAAGSYADLPPIFFVALLLITLLVALGVSAVGLLVAVWSRQASGAVLGTYAALALLAVVVVGAPVPALHPFWVLEACWGDVNDVLVLGRLGEAALAWGAVAAAGLGLAIVSLRPGYRRQLEGEGRKRDRAGPERAPVGDDPVRWKEYHVEGLALLRPLRRVPRPVGVAIVVALAAAASLLSLRAAWSATRPDPTLFVTQASAFLLVAALAVAVRCAGAITGERERGSWESLLLAPIDGRAYLRGKLLGLRDAVVPYYLAYAAPALSISLAGGLVALVATVCGLLVGWAVIYYAAACGLP